MADVVNIRFARKNKKRADHAQQGAENRAKFGRTKAEKEREEAQSSLDRRRLNDAKLDDDKP
jgi:hypothetical protein